MKRQRQAGLMVLCVGFSPLCGAEVTDSKDITVQGKIIASPCMVEQPNINVNLGDTIRMNDLATAGSFTEWVSFTLRVYHCPPQITTATVTFNGAADVSNPDFRYQNSGTATNVAVELLTTDGLPLGNDKSLTGAIVNQEYTWNLRARVWTETGSVKPGTVSAVVSATLTYQ